LHLIIVVELFSREMFLYVKKWSPETHLLPVRSA
jgi:hypothetical protein